MRSKFAIINFSGAGWLSTVRLSTDQLSAGQLSQIQFQ